MDERALRRLGRVARVVAPPVFIALLLWRVEVRSIGAHLARLDVRFVGAFLAVSVLLYAVCAWRWSFTASRLGVALPLRRAVLDYYLSTLLNQVLPVGVAGDVVAGREAVVPAAGKYALWVRYADYRNKKESFGIRIKQAGKSFSQVFGEHAVIDELDPMKLRWDWAFGWDHAEADLQKGTFHIELYTTGPTEARRQVDCVCLTTDAGYHPAGREKPDCAAWLPLRAARAAFSLRWAGFSPCGVSALMMAILPRNASPASAIWSWVALPRSITSASTPCSARISAARSDSCTRTHCFSTKDSHVAAPPSPSTSKFTPSPGCCSRDQSTTFKSRG